jgi:hypothetical protein
MKPILFSTPMVQAILKGQKTQTRRVVKDPHAIDLLEMGQPNNALSLCSRRPGDILWVRETWQHTKVLNLHPTDDCYGYVYRADGQPWEDYEGWTWKPSIFMPKEACRIFLQVTNIRVERLDAISETDAIEEGIELIEHNCFKNYMQGKDWFYNHKNQNGFEMLEGPIGSFFSLWAKINGNDSLNENPLVWVYEFEVISKPRALEQQDAVIKTCKCEMPAKIHGKNLCWRCKRPLS